MYCKNLSIKKKNISKKLAVPVLSIVLATSLLGCSNNSSENNNIDTSTNEVSNKSSEADTIVDDSTGYAVEITKSQLKLNEKIRSEAIKGDFVKINSNEMLGQKVFIEGKVSVVDYENTMDLFPSFLLSSKEGDGSGIYHITNVLQYQNIEDGDTVRVYATVSKDRTDAGIPKLTANIVESIDSISE